MRLCCLLLLLAGCETTSAEPAPVREIEAHAAAAAPRTDPLASAWQAAPAMVVPLLPQDQVEPKTAEAGPAELHVRALVDHEWLTVRLDWPDATRDDALEPSRMSDAAALQLPFAPGADVPDPAMGLAGKPVHIVYWKAAWQRAPAPAHADHRPPEAASGEARAELERLYSPARNAGNPVALRQPGDAVQDLLASGPGTLAAAREQLAEGHGAWQADRWYVVLALPIAAGSLRDFAAGRRAHAAFALWDGSKGHVGARKMRSGWVPLVHP